LIALTYAALFLTVLTLWAGRRFWIPLGVITVALGYVSGILQGFAALWVALFTALCLCYTRAKHSQSGSGARWITSLCAAGIVLLSLALGMHALPGFNNLLIAKDLVLSSGAAPYTLYLNIDKTIPGVLILGLLYASLLNDRQAWVVSLRRAAPIALTTIGFVIVMSIAAGYVRLDPKWTGYFWIWAASNLLLTCLAEEAFFRGFLQRELALGLARYRYGAAIAVSVSAVAFGVAHFAGGPLYVVLSTFAGAGYALVYQRTSRIEMSILTHFALNATHFLFFTYPRTV